MKDSLDKIFRPRSVAIVGASNDPRRWGYHTLTNMLEAGYRHRIYPVNPGEQEIQGIRCYNSITEVPGEIDLAIIVVNTSLISKVIQECTTKNVKGGIVITAGFAEISNEGAELQDKIARMAKEAGFHFIGPNCWGIWSSDGNVNTVFNQDMHLSKGQISFLSQSGTLGEYFCNATRKCGFGASKFISCGNQACITFNDILEYLGEDSSTKVITAYVEDVGDGRRFLEVARKITDRKPLLLVKAGSTPSAARACLSHTAAIAGNDDVFDAACRQAGIIRWHDFTEMFDMAEALCYQPHPKGNRVAVISPGGGFCVTAAEACTRLGLELPVLSAGAQKKILEQMGSFAPPPLNPIDAIARKSMDAYQDIIEIMASQDYIDGIIMTPRLGRFDRTKNPRGVIKKIELTERAAAIPEKYGKPLICASEHELAGPFYEIYKRKHIPFFDNPMDCAKVMYGLVQYGTRKRGEL